MLHAGSILQKRDAGGVRGLDIWAERRTGTYGKKQTSRLGIRIPGFPFWFCL